MKRILFVVLGSLVVWFYFTPHLTVRGMQSAIEAGDAARFASYVDFPALRANLKTTLHHRLQTELGSQASTKRHELATALGTALVAAILNPVIDAIVTPDGIARIMAGEKLASSRTPRPDEPAIPPTSAPAQSARRSKLTIEYESFDRFVAKSTQSAARGEQGALVFTRDGWFAWKLRGIRLPG